MRVVVDTCKKKVVVLHDNAHGELASLHEFSLTWGMSLSGVRYPVLVSC